jgi:hypothetical protein
MILTIAVPAAHVADANQLAMALGFSTAEELTYGEPTWQGSADNLYSAASFGVEPTFINTATSTLQRPAWDIGAVVDMVAVARAQTLILAWTYGDSATAPQADPNAITAILGMDGLDALEIMGLTIMPQEI